MNKTLGQVAHEAFWKAADGSDDWERVTDCGKARWEAAALAVVNELYGRIDEQGHNSQSQ